MRARKKVEVKVKAEEKLKAEKAAKPGSSSTSTLTSKKAPKKHSRPSGLIAPPSKLPTAPTDKEVVSRIADNARDMNRKILAKQAPSLHFPLRALSNVHYKSDEGYFEIGKQRKTRTLSVNTVKPFAQTLRMMALSKSLVETSDFATKRDAYYQSKNWGDARFDEQAESDAIMDDIEALFSIYTMSREQLRFIPEEHGGAVAGQLTVYDKDIQTGKTEVIDCTRFGSGAYSIPSLNEHLRFETKAKFILAIETGGIFQRLQSHKYWSKANCILISMGGVPTRATRRFIRRLSEQCRIPVYAFVDCDPYGISNIYRTLKVGSGNAAHINRFFCVPWVRFLGVTPQDIRDFKLPTHPLLEVDVKRARDAIKNDPFFHFHKEWKAALEQLIEMGVRAEQQAFAAHTLNYVMDEYLPFKLKHVDSFLP